MSAPAPARSESVKSSGEVAVEVEVDGRWDALGLSEQLIRFHSFLVQHGPERWVVHARCPGWNGEPLDAALAVIDAWREEHSTATAVRVQAPLEGGRG